MASLAWDALLTAGTGVGLRRAWVLDEPGRTQTPPLVPSVRGAGRWQRARAVTEGAVRATLLVLISQRGPAHSPPRRGLRVAELGGGGRGWWWHRARHLRTAGEGTLRQLRGSPQLMGWEASRASPGRRPGRPGAQHGHQLAGFGTRRPQRESRGSCLWPGASGSGRRVWVPLLWLASDARPPPASPAVRGHAGRDAAASAVADGASVARRSQSGCAVACGRHQEAPGDPRLPDGNSGHPHARPAPWPPSVPRCPLCRWVAVAWGSLAAP